MNITEVRNVIRQAIAEAVEKGGLQKSPNKLVHLKKEMDSLKKMKESLGSFQIAEGGEQPFVAEYAHMQKYVNEYNKLKDAHAKLAEMLDGQITEVDTRIKSETEKIKEMMGLIEKEKPSAGMTKKEKSAVAKKAHAGGDIGKKGKGFEKVEKAAEKEYGSKEAGQKVAAAAMWKGQAKK